MQRPATDAEARGTNQAVREQPAAAFGYEGSCSKDQWELISRALEIAKKLVDQVLEDLPIAKGDKPHESDLLTQTGRKLHVKDTGKVGGQLKEKTKAALLWHFRIGLENDKDIDIIQKDISRIRQTFFNIRVGLELELLSCKDAKGECGPLAELRAKLGVLQGTSAYFDPQATLGEEAFGRPVFLCPIFFEDEPLVQACVLIHEVTHGLGLPQAPLTRDVYRESTEYRALSKDEALVTADVYATFARDNTHGLPIRVAGAPFGAVRGGLAAQEARFVLTWGAAVEFSHPVLSIVNPVAGFEFIFMPPTSQKDFRILLAGTLGLRLAQRGERFYLDLRAGAAVGAEFKDDGMRQLAAALTEVSLHFQPGQFDIQAFWQQYHSLFEGRDSLTIIGVGVDIPIPE